MKYKYKLNLFSSVDPKTIEEDLNNMSASGYELVEMGPVFSTFKKCELNSKKYAVVIQEEMTEFESGVNVFDEFCFEAGWVKIAKNGNILIYENEDLNATHISTDVGVEYENARRYMKKGTIIQGIFLAGAAYFMWYLIFNNALIDRFDFLSDYLAMFASLVVVAMFFVLAINVVLGVYWIIKSDKLMKTSNRYLSMRTYSKVTNYEAVVLTAIFVCFILMMFLTKNYLVGIHYISYILFLFVIVTFSNGAINRVEREVSKEQKTKKRILGFTKLVIFIVAAIIYISTPDGRATYDSEGTIWLYKDQAILWEGDYYMYDHYYPKNERVYDYVLNYLQSHNEDGYIIREKDGNIFAIEADTPLEYQEMILEKTAKF